MADLRLVTVKDEAGASIDIILDHPNGATVAMTGSAVTTAGLNSPLAWVKNLGPGTVYLRGDGAQAGAADAGSYPLYASQDWSLAVDNNARTLSLAGPVGTSVKVFPAKAVVGTTPVGGVAGSAGFTDADIDAAIPLPSTAANRPDVGRLVPLLKKIRAALDTTFGTIPWDAITGSIDANTQLITRLAQYALVGHTHSRTDNTLIGFGTAAALNISTTGQAAANELVKGDDPRINPGVWAPLVHTQAEATVTGLPGHLAILASDPIPFIIPNAAVGTYVLDEYSWTAGTIGALVDRLVSGSGVTYKIQVGGVDVAGLAARTPTATQALTNATSANTYAVGARTTLVVTAATTPGVLAGTIGRTRTLP